MSMSGLSSLGAPNETQKAIKKTLDFTQQIDIDIPRIGILEANLGTLLWEEYKNKGLLDEEKHLESMVLIPDISPEAVHTYELLRMINRHYQNHLSNPQYILKQIPLTVGTSYRRNIVRSNLGRVEVIKNSINDLTTEKHNLSLADRPLNA